MYIKQTVVVVSTSSKDASYMRLRLDELEFYVHVSLSQQVKNPQRDLPLGIATALSICCALYMLVSIVIVGLVPYNAMDPDTPISTAFASHGMQWAA